MGIFNYLLVVAFLIWTSFSLWKIIDVRRRRAASTSWPLVIGSVTGKRVDVQSGSKGGRTYTPQVTYTYSILGSVVTKTVSMGGKLRKSDAEAALDQVGQTIHARYNPQNPSQHISDLEQVTFSDILTLLVALLFLVTSLLPLLFGTQTTSSSTH